MRASELLEGPWDPKPKTSVPSSGPRQGPWGPRPEKPRMSVRAATTAPQPVVQPEPEVNPPAEEPKPETLSIDRLIDTLLSLPKREKQKILTRLLSDLGTPVR